MPLGLELCLDLVVDRADEGGLDLDADAGRPEHGVCKNERLDRDAEEDDEGDEISLPLFTCHPFAQEAHQNSVGGADQVKQTKQP